MNTHYAGLVLLRAYPGMPGLRRLVLEHMLPVLRKEHVEYWDNGQMSVCGFKDRGEHVGKWTWWYPNGQIWRQGRFTAGKRTGQWTWWWQTGQMRGQGHYNANKRVGQWKHWTEDGVLESYKDI